MKKPFPAPYKKLKDISSGAYENCIGRVPQFLPGKVAIYLDPRGDTSMVAALPDYYADFFGDSIPLFHHTAIYREGNTAFVRTKSSIDAIERLVRDINNEFYERVLNASRKKVIAYSLAYIAKDENGRGVSANQNSFSALPLIGFDYAVRYLVDGKLYVIRIEEDAEDREKETLDREHFAHNNFKATATIEWSKEAEASCAAFKLALAGIGQRLYEYFKQDPVALKLALESQVSPLRLENQA